MQKPVNPDYTMLHIYTLSVALVEYLELAADQVKPYYRQGFKKNAKEFIKRAEQLDSEVYTHMSNSKEDVPSFCQITTDKLEQIKQLLEQ